MMRWLLLIIACIMIGYGLYFFVMPSAMEQKLAQANASYSNAVQSKTIYDRKTYFNEALTLLSDLEREKNLQMGNGKLYFDLGNVYFELEAYPFALLYYYRAAQLDPGNGEIEQYIRMAKERLQLSVDEPSVFRHLFFFHHYLPVPKRLQLIFIFGLAATILASGAFWLRKWRLAQMAAVSLAVCLVFTLSALYSRYVEPLEAVLVKASMLTREAEKLDDWATEAPTPAGTKVIVLDVLENGLWLKVSTPKGTLGYIPADRVRVI